jgi:DNA-binding CsgD family transcriptional regulator
MPDLLATYADCVASLHEAALLPERWPDALQASMRLFGASGILLTDIDTRLGTPRSIQTGGHEPALLAAYAGHYESIDPTIAVGMAGAHGTVYHLREHFSEQQMSRMEYFQDFLFAFGVADVMATPIDYASGARLFVSLQRRTGERPFNTKCHPLLAQFSRQVNIAKQTEARLLASSQSNRALASGLDAFSAAMFIVNAKAALRHHNRAADVLLNARKGLEFQSGHLRITSASAHARLLHALRSASPPSSQAAIFTMTAAGGGALQVLTTPLWPAQDLAASWQEPLVLVIVWDTQNAALAASQSMRQLYRLTAAESRLVAELADGKTLREIADVRAVSLATLRSQLKAAFGKTGARRQLDLVRLVAALAPISVAREETSRGDI